ncbi:MAG TPA: hypothetical protein VKQ36_17650 [Ktedonobacterales bacterium]|nr:hypothetical protein [Ktedonobacterales bacterium]
MKTDEAATSQTDASATGRLLAEKLAAFERIREDFSASFTYLQDVHGQRSFSSFPVEATVHYLHALWVCECKDLLLSVPQTASRYDGRRALEALRDWQEGDVSPAVALLERKLEHMPFAAITQAFQQAERQGDQALAQRLAHGRWNLLNRAQNLHHALQGVFALSSQVLVQQAREAAAQYSHTPQQIEAQLAEVQTPVYGFLRSPVLAQRNMVLMNTLGILVTGDDADRPGRRTMIVQAPTMPQPPYAEHVVVGEMTLVFSRR